MPTRATVPRTARLGAELPGQGRDLVAGGPSDEVFDRVDIVQGLPAQTMVTSSIRLFRAMAWRAPSALT